jgi:hypothetical protein
MLASLIARVITRATYARRLVVAPSPGRTYLVYFLANQRWKLGERLIRDSAALAGSLHRRID